MPRIIVTMPTRNRANLIGRAIRSLGRQTFQDFELLVGDDGCTDGTPEAVEREAKAAGVAFRIIGGEGRHVGQTSMRNRMIRETDSEFIAALDDDDEAAPDRLATGIRMMEGDPRMAVTGGAVVRWYETTGRGRTWRGPGTDMGIRRRALRSAPFHHSTVMMRRSHLPSQEPYDRTMKRGQDALLWAQMTKRDGIRFSNTGRIMAVVHFHRQQVDGTAILAAQKASHERQVEVNAEFLARHGSLKDVAVARWLAVAKWRNVEEPGLIPDSDRVRAVYAGLDRWGRRIAGPGLAWAIEQKTPWHGRLDLRGPVSLKRRILASRALRVAAGIHWRRFPRRNRTARKPRREAKEA